jgi:hypothetical protein
LAYGLIKSYRRAISGIFRSPLLQACTGSGLQHVIQVSDVANRQPEDFDFRELFVRRQGRQQLSQLGECRIEGFDSNSLPDEININ